MTLHIRLPEIESISFSGGPIGLLQILRSVVQGRQSGPGLRLPPRNCYSSPVPGILRYMLCVRRNIPLLDFRKSS